jgi:hypothetical protein
MGMMDKMMESMIGRMSKDDKEEMMGKMMENFFADFTAEDRQKMMEEMMPKMMEGVDMMKMMPKMMMSMMGGGEGNHGMMGSGESEQGMMGMMSRMMGSSKEGEAPTMMPQMMEEMMPRCIEIMLPHLPEEAKVSFVLKMVEIMMEKASEGMSDEKKEAFVAQVTEKIMS